MNYHSLQKTPFITHLGFTHLTVLLLLSRQQTFRHFSILKQWTTLMKQWTNFWRKKKLKSHITQTLTFQGTINDISSKFFDSSFISRVCKPVNEKNVYKRRFFKKKSLVLLRLLVDSVWFLKNACCCGKRNIFLKPEISGFTFHYKFGIKKFDKFFKKIYSFKNF